MAAPNPPQQLCVPDRTFFQFPNQIPSSLCEKKFEDYVSHLQDEDAAQVVDWLDNVRLRIVFSPPTLFITSPGSTHSGSCKSSIPGVRSSTSMGMRRSGNTTEILYNFTHFSFEHK